MYKQSSQNRQRSSARVKKCQFEFHDSELFNKRGLDNLTHNVGAVFGSYVLP